MQLYSGDVSKEIDNRVKGEVAKLRGKDNYELGDLSIALDTIAKDMTCQLSGKEKYEVGDLSKQIDSRIKGVVENYTVSTSKGIKFSILLRWRYFWRAVLFINARAFPAPVFNNYTHAYQGKPYETGDLTREVSRRVSDAVKEFTGKGQYEFGDVSKEIERRRAKWVKEYLGNEEYEFGDITKKAVTDFTGKVFLLLYLSSVVNPVNLLVYHM